jgi:hypothetical protein
MAKFPTTTCSQKEAMPLCRTIHHNAFSIAAGA